MSKQAAEHHIKAAEHHEHAAAHHREAARHVNFPVLALRAQPEVKSADASKTPASATVAH